MKGKLLVTGGNGMVGSVFQHALHDYSQVIIAPRYLDLRREDDAVELFECKPDHVIHLAAKVGGLAANTNFPATFFTDNVRINTNVLDRAYFAGVKKVVSVMSTCIYPAEGITYPLTEDQLHNGEPHSSNFAYAYAKRMLDVQSRAYRKQYGCNFVTAVANNLFGPNDFFGLKNSHVLPAMIRKMFEAKQRGDSEIILWGDGTPAREFTFSRDLANILLFVLDEYNEESPINVGNTASYSIAEVAGMVADCVGFTGELLWSGETCGQQKKPSSNKKLRVLGWEEGEFTPMKQALRETVDWFVANYPNVRGMNDV
jgi:GDP-L-fucose synthase